MEKCSRMVKQWLLDVTSCSNYCLISILLLMLKLAILTIKPDTGTH